LTVFPAEIAGQFAGIATRLDLSFNELASLTNVGAMLRLRDLILDNNNLGDDLQLPSLPQLETLSLNKNRIVNVEPLLDQITRSCPKLTFLSLLGNAACPNELVEKDEDDYRRYRLFVLFKLPKLRFLDSRPVRPEERSEAARVGPFMRVVRPTDDQIVMHPPTEEEEQTDEYTALPSTLAADHPDASGRATFGVLRYVYFGKHSEGNRFIRNNDL
jgi:leucine-rich melanocyte differentiation-associated protein